ncbi:RNA pseudouridine synthase 6, chloroplastic [Senna tora]|uniref:RNA pseudouridine synthase 6, chloroplastic n=1 Tax=Senna tora TaxID=362788 RepID=A0A834X9N9_9FABA|nr:RNA pseudouridine synthase 6, chloroplastic [Senna tora]
MGSTLTLTLASTLASSRWSFGEPLAMAMAPTLETSHSSLNKHSLKCCSPARSHSIALATESSSIDSTTASSSNRYPSYDRLLPCPSQHSAPPRVEHLVVSEGGPVLEYICKALDFPPLFVADLIQFGAVYYALVHPKPPPSATQEEIRIFKEATNPSILRERSSIKGKTIQEAQKTLRITHVDQFVEPGTYLRVYVHPKRFPRCYEIHWRSRIIAVAESYVVLDKPAGTSVGGTTNNIEETCATFAARALGLTTPLMTTHQIDNCTEGCVVLARTKEYCSVFHGKIRDKKVKKLYLALAAARLPSGIITHYMRPTNRAPRLISEDYIEGWHLCQLEVMECRKVPWPSTVIQDKYCIEECGWPSQDYAYECKLDLITGKTHQIRAQFAACKAPLIGDSMYMPVSLAEIANPGLNPFGKYKKDFSSESEKEMAILNWIAQHGKEPSVAIGLQACEISWDDGEHFYKAGSPWWRWEENA